MLKRRVLIMFSLMIILLLIFVGVPLTVVVYSAIFGLAIFGMIFFLVSMVVAPLFGIPV